MKFFGQYFWGLLLIVAGVAIVLKQYFNLNIPVVRTIIAFIFIFLGLSILFGSFGGDYTAVLGSRNMKMVEDVSEYNFIFASGNITVPNELHQSLKHKNLNVIFSNVTLVLESEPGVTVKVDSVFSNSTFPDGNSSSFGTYTYRKSNQSEKDKLIIDTKCCL